MDFSTYNHSFSNMNLLFDKSYYNTHFGGGGNFQEKVHFTVTETQILRK